MALGVALGAAAKSALDTYGTLQRFQQVADERKEREEERKRQQAIRDASAETLGKIGELRPVGYEAITPDAPEGTIPAQRMAPYTEADAYRDFSSRIAGIDPNAAIQARSAGIQIGRLARQEQDAETVRKAAEVFRSRLEMFKQAHDEAGGDVHTALARLSPEISRTTGLSVGVKTNPDGTSVVQLSNAKGKVVEEFPATMEEVMPRLQAAARDEFLASVSSVNPEMAVQLLELEMQRAKNQTDAGHKERELGLREQYYNMLGKYYEGMLQNQRAQISAGRPKSERDLVRERVEAYADMLVKSGEEPDPDKALTRAWRELSKVKTDPQFQVFSELGLIRRGDKLYTLDTSNPSDPTRLVEVTFPGEDLTSRAVAGLTDEDFASLGTEGAGRTGAITPPQGGSGRTDLVGEVRRLATEGSGPLGVGRLIGPEERAIWERLSAITPETLRPRGIPHAEPGRDYGTPRERQPNRPTRMPPIPHEEPVTPPPQAPSRAELEARFRQLAAVVHDPRMQALRGTNHPQAAGLERIWEEYNQLAELLTPKR